MIIQHNLYLCHHWQLIFDINIRKEQRERDKVLTLRRWNSLPHSNFTLDTSGHRSYSVNYIPSLMKFSHIGLLCIRHYNIDQSHQYIVHVILIENKEERERRKETSRWNKYHPQYRGVYVPHLHIKWMIKFYIKLD